MMDRRTLSANILLLLLSIHTVEAMAQSANWFWNRNRPAPVDKPPINRPFCEIANNPDKQFQASNSTVLQLVQWRTKMLNSKVSAETCLKACPNPTSAMMDFCHSLNWCRSNCTTSNIIKNCSKNTLASRDTLCVANNCSPLPPPSEYYDASKIIPDPNIKSEPASAARYTVAKRSPDLKVSKQDVELRKKIFLEISRKIIREFEETRYTVLFPDEMPDDKVAYYSGLANTYRSRFHDVKKYLTSQPSAKNHYLQHMPETMLCINLPTRAGGENHFLEVMEQNNECGNAFGIGQVISMTFYSNLGLNLSKYGFSTQNLEKNCKRSSLQFIATECGPDIFQSQFYRAEIFDNYNSLTIDQIFDRRAFDMELQVRLMFATIINSFAMTQNWWGAFTSYRGNGTSYYANFTPGKDPCMTTHMADQYNSQGAL